ncbi:MAG TPA: dihydrofolate reductase family protein [Candidatus Didemnitutus sp.]|nr:dihydrofolate reductase family protein [Candidatus Didemnitutus sp.]
MRKLIYYVAASLDGCIARRDGAVDWLPTPTAKEDYGYAKFLGRVDTLLMGRKTYEQMLTFGPWAYGERKCYVLTRKWAGQRDVHAEFIGGNIATLVRRLKRQPGRDIWLVGGGESAHACFEAGVVDEIILTQVPVLLGDGLPLFLPRETSDRLVLKDSHAFTEGLVQLSYEVDGPLRGARPSVLRRSYPSSGSTVTPTRGAAGMLPVKTPRVGLKSA